MSDRLDGWKAIAAYVRRSVRTAQRWEQELGLPVHRVHMDAGEIVYARAVEIDAWLHDREKPRSPAAALPSPGNESGPSPVATAAHGAGVPPPAAVAPAALPVVRVPQMSATPHTRTRRRLQRVPPWAAILALLSIGALLGYAAGRLG